MVNKSPGTITRPCLWSQHQLLGTYLQVIILWRKNDEQILGSASLLEYPLYSWYYRPCICHLVLVECVLFLNPGGQADGVISDISGPRFWPVSNAKDAIGVLSSNPGESGQCTYFTHEEAAGFLNVALGYTQDTWINQLALLNLIWVQSTLRTLLLDSCTD